jgi:hypothetical protein
MADLVGARETVMQALRAHFDGSGERVGVDEIMDMTGLDQNAVENALRRLKQMNRIDGTMVAEFQHPIWVTSINYD